MISKYTIESLECKRNVESEKIEKYRLDYKVDYGERTLLKKEKLLEVEFTFVLSYLEDIGRINVKGKIYFSDNLKKLKEIDDNWSGDKEAQKQAINTIYVNVIAMVYDTTRHLGLPAPVALPVFTPGEGI